MDSELVLRHGEEALQYTGLLRIPQHSTMLKIISKIWEEEHKGCFEMETPTAAPIRTEAFIHGGCWFFHYIFFSIICGWWISHHKTREFCSIAFSISLLLWCFNILMRANGVEQTGAPAETNECHPSLKIAEAYCLLLFASVFGWTVWLWSICVWQFHILGHLCAPSTVCRGLWSTA